jgi:hypothetical protein
VACVRAAASRYVMPRDIYLFFLSGGTHTTLYSDTITQRLYLRLPPLTMHSATRSGQLVATVRSRHVNAPDIRTSSISSFEMRTKPWPRRQGSQADRPHRAAATGPRVVRILPHICMSYLNSPDILLRDTSLCIAGSCSECGETIR